MMFNTLKPNTTKPSGKRVGRGGKRGKTSGAGMKGQSARQGNSKRPAIRDLIKSIPKRRGYGKNRAKTVVFKLPALVVNTDQLQENFKAGDTVSVKTLAEKGLITSRKSQNQSVKILGNGELNIKLSVTDCLVSKSAAEKITAAGGTIENAA